MEAQPLPDPAPSAVRQTQFPCKHCGAMLEFEPGTNSIEVHVSRLRAKLAFAGIHGLVETVPPGGYRVAR